MGMTTYNVRGTIYMESSGDEARYDVDMEWHELEARPSEMDVLRWLLDTGDIQILLDAVEEVE